MDKTRTQR